ncbi:MAG TPA: hypothetical protein VD927_10735 [Chryseosolibacter sp.]|nr:hypothetical protein [Chryseosolibacter sp.]
MATIAKTVGSFDKVLASCTTIGAQYQPNVAELSHAALSQLQVRAQQSLGAVTATRIAYRMAVNDRSDSFAGISKLASRVVNMMSVYARESASHLEDADRIKKMLYSPRRSQTSALNSEGVTGATKRSSGRLSYDQRIETFSNLVKLAEKLPNYLPVEPEMTLKGLKQKLAELRAKSDAVIRAKAAFKKAMLARNQVLFGKDGIIEITKAVKHYIVAAFGHGSDESSQMAVV